MGARKVTVFSLCDGHKPWLGDEGRYRLAECFGEGGPYNSPCKDGSCKIRPGTDLFGGDICGQREWFDTATDGHPFSWWANNPDDHGRRRL